MTLNEFEVLHKYLGGEKALEVATHHIPELQTIENVEDYAIDCIYKGDYDKAIENLSALERIQKLFNIKKKATTVVIKRYSTDYFNFEIVDSVTQIDYLFKKEG